MISFLTSCELFVRLGLVYSILAMGYYVSYTILDFPDLTVEGTFLSGAVVYGIMVSHGVSGWLGMGAERKAEDTSAALRDIGLNGAYFNKPCGYLGGRSGA